MGFYGNITNTSNTTFSFDRIYPNRLAMDANANNDGIFIGRYVLVEYDQDAAYPNVFLKDGRYYSSPNTEDLTRVRFLSGKRYYYEPTTDEYPIKGKQYYIKIEDGAFKPVDIKTNIKFEDLEITYYEKVESVDGVYREEIVQVQRINTDDKGHTTYINIGFYECNGFVTEDSIEYATFKEADKDPTAKSNYIQNFAIDEKHQDAEQQKSFKGYDSTVWVKSSITTNDGKLITKYVNIADLNSVVPTFDIAADAPTMEPITPHFDADSTNVYYKLHMQTPYGFRVKEEIDGEKSDVTTNHYTTIYNKQTDNTYTSIEENVNASIYYNQKAFDPKEANAHVKDSEGQELPNYIKIEPTGKSSKYNNYQHKVSSYYRSKGKLPRNEYEVNKYYYLEDNKFILSTEYKTDTEYFEKIDKEIGDIQEFSLHLPAIGNMMSDAWDIIHGKQRNDYRGDGENSSLQGRLDAFQDICANQIAVKSSDEDGTIVGSKINNGEKYVHEGDILDKRLNVEDEGLLNNDDPWIRTYINTADLVHSTYQGDSGLSQEDNNGIAIQHTFHATADSETSLDKNSGEAQVSERQEKYIHAIKDSNGNIIKTPINAEVGNKTDEIKLYTPYVDATGHVVGKNIETVTLPYGYKTFTTEGLAPLDDEDKEIVEDLYTIINNQADGSNTSSSSASASTSIANNTQDSIAIEPYNKWIQTQLSDDKLVIAHEVHAINTEKDTTNLNDLKDDKIQNEINIPDWDYDEAGHIKKKGEHTYTLPFGFKTIKVNNTPDTVVSNAAQDIKSQGQIADNTQDTLILSASNRWIKLDNNTENTVKIGHQVNPINEVLSNLGDNQTSHTNLNSDDKGNETEKNLTIYDWKYDAAGHITEKRAHTYTLPYGYKTIKVTNNSNGVAAPASTVVEAGQSADQTQDTLNLNASNKWIVLDNAEDDIIKFGHKISDLPKGWHSSSDTTIGEFGQSFKILKYETDEAGHVIDSGEDVITIPQGSYTAATEASGSKEIITSIGFTPSSGAITSTKANTDTLSLSNYSANTNEYSKLVDIIDTDTINNAFKKIQNHINGLNLNVNEVTDDTKIITGIVQKNGQVSLSRSTAGNLQIGTPSTDGTIPANSSLNNAFNITNNRIKKEEDALAQEVQDRKDAIAKEVQDRKDAIANAIAGIFNKNDDNEINKLAEIIEWINNNPSTATEMQTAIQNNTNAISNEVDLAREKEAEIADALTTETGRATAAEQTNATAIENEKTRAENIEKGLQDQIDTLQTWKETATKDIADLNNTISQLLETINDLTTRIENLENPPQEPDSGGDEA